MESIAAVLATYGIPFVERSQDHAYARVPTWDGEQLNLPGPVEDDPQFVFHEMSHYLIAPDHARKLPNYGLGTDPAGGKCVDPVSGSWRGEDSYHDEMSACLLDLWLMHKHGWDRLIPYHKDMYGVRDYDLREVNICRVILTAAGLDADQIVVFYEETEACASRLREKNKVDRKY